MEPRIRDEIGAIAVLAFALLSTVALATDQGAVLQWWRSAFFAFLGWAAVLVPLARGARALERVFGFARRERVLPIVGGLVVVLALLGLTRHYMRDNVAGGFVGGALANAASGHFGQIGAPIALGALLLVGLVIAANRTIADLWKPIWRQRPDMGGLKPGTLIPGGTATRFDRFADDGDELPAEAVRIHIPEEKPVRKPLAPAQLPKPSLPGGAEALTGLSPTPGRGPSEVGPSPTSDVERKPFAVSAVGLASAAVIAEGVLHAEPPEKPWVLPAIDQLDQGSAARSGKDELLRNQRVIEETLSHFGIAAHVVDVFVGPVVTRYELKPAAGVKLSRIEALADDLSLALAARTLRIEAPIPGKSVVGIEIPNLAIGLVSVRDVAGFNGVPHLVVPVMHDSPQILNALYWTTSEMDRRYRLFARANARNIASYNEKHTGTDRVPYVVFIIDELADLMLQAPIQVEKQITRVAQLARATGIHLVLGTQRPAVAAITGLIQANVPARVAFATASSVDSRTIIDMTGAEKLLGRGELLG